MQVDHIHFYVRDAVEWRQWFQRVLQFQPLGCDQSQHTHTEILRHHSVYVVLSAPITGESPVAKYLCCHPSGVVDVALAVDHLESWLERVQDQGGKLLRPFQIQTQGQGCLKWFQLAAWGTLRHTVVERSGITPLLPDSDQVWVSADSVQANDSPIFTGIDHLVLNVAEGTLEEVGQWYSQILGFQPQQQFLIQTQSSGLRSQVLYSPGGKVQLPLNEPTSTNSQIQEFLDLNGGPGIQHIALQTPNLIGTIAELRRQGLAFLPVPVQYYEQLYQRQGFQISDKELMAIAEQQILVDWQTQQSALLLQTFTQALFEQPTFFFELIERRTHWDGQQWIQVKGFGERNFQALFQAIEAEQQKRGSL